MCSPPAHTGDAGNCRDAGCWPCHEDEIHYLTPSWLDSTCMRSADPCMVVQSKIGRQHARMHVYTRHPSTGRRRRPLRRSSPTTSAPLVHRHGVDTHGSDTPRPGVRRRSHTSSSGAPPFALPRSRGQRRNHHARPRSFAARESTYIRYAMLINYFTTYILARIWLQV
jgi:hypothetical protein